VFNLSTLPQKNLKDATRMLFKNTKYWTDGQNSFAEQSKKNKVLDITGRI
jgi:hypothetical protein